MVNKDESKVKFRIERRAEYKRYFQWGGSIGGRGYVRTPVASDLSCSTLRWSPHVTSPARLCTKTRLSLYCSLYYADPP